MSTRPFFETLRDIEYGHLMEELAEKQKEVIDAAIATGKKGAITLSITYTPEGQDQITVAADLKHKTPEHPRGKTIFFVAPDSSLSRSDPRQIDIESLRTVDHNDQPAKELNHG